MKCEICNNKELIPFIKKEGINYYICLNCNLIQQIPKPENSDIINIYDGNKIYFQNKKKGINLDREQKIGKKEIFYYHLIKPYVPNKKIKIIDIGAGTGTMLGIFKKKGFINLNGIELSSWACAKAEQNFNLKLRNENIGNVNYQASSFDLIIMNHVIEHLVDPLKTLKKISHIIKKKGILFLSTPNVSCLSSILLKKKWKYFIPNEHIFLFNENSIEFILKKTGFKIIEIKKCLYKCPNFIEYIKQMTKIIFKNCYKKFFKNFKTKIFDNFSTNRDGLIVVAEKI